MELVAFSLEGYRRFVERTSVKLHGDMIAFVGPNEAGKSSLLKALAHLNSNRPFEPNEYPRRSEVAPKLTWTFLLDSDDKALLAAIPDTEQVEQLAITKNADGAKTWAFKPASPSRSRETRGKVLNILRGLQSEGWVSSANEADDSDFSLEVLDDVVDLLDSDPADFSESDVELFGTLADLLDAIAFDNDHDEDKQGDEEPDGSLSKCQVAVTEVRRLASEESCPSPWRQSVDALRTRLPQVEFFSAPDRQLAAEYDLIDVAGDPPPALFHLANLAGLDLAALRDEAVSGSIADVSTRRNSANAHLKGAFAKSWNQQRVAIQLEVQGTVLHIQATTPEDDGLSSISGRSDGMRWFAALLAFSHGWDDSPILLLDEIETHLHYDAQAD